MEAKYLKKAKKELIGKTFAFFSYGESSEIIIHFTKNIAYLLFPQTGVIRASYKHGAVGLFARRVLVPNQEEFKEISLEELLTTKELGLRKAAKEILEELKDAN